LLCKRTNPPLGGLVRLQSRLQNKEMMQFFLKKKWRGGFSRGNVSRIIERSGFGNGLFKRNESESKYLILMMLLIKNKQDCMVGMTINQER
ncbi:hypothetical protein, partial [Pantoea sp. B9002]|uniref:hypothetical protein n=1 Tax=Pantoea sp. B9002 TaxID=2726979 RepID=UPI001C432C76